ncbi:hypothetical protein H2200_003174 [Cladophialophora chaetospira]|uniref:Uncharacterized protein n=1 Tax=Cladophialophora chaetospira TaxID=386627 RepID=A0AA38XGY3_9EURO|nr:hypothetical protein H2200_003174 [Cladophialophora chaetospira]
MFNPNAKPFGATLPTLATSQHSQVRQEADYIQERIVASTVLCRKLTSEIKKGEKRLGKAREDGCSEEPIISLKKKIKKQRSRLNRGARNQQLLEERLRAILGEIEKLEQRQWRRSAPQLYTPQNMGAGHTANPQYDVFWSMHPQPPTPALCPPPMLPLHMQGPYHPVVGYVPRAPVLQPVQVPRLAYTQPKQQIVPFLDGMEMSPADTMSPYDLTGPTSFPVAHNFDLADGVDNMQISDVQPMATQSHGSNLSLIASMPDNQSAAIRLQRAARKGKE